MSGFSFSKREMISVSMSFEEPGWLDHQVSSVTSPEPEEFFLACGSVEEVPAQAERETEAVLSARTERN